MEFYFREIGLRHLQHIGRVGHEYVAAFAVFGHILVFAFLEVFQYGFVVALYPTGLVQRYGIPLALCAVFVQQAVLYYFELQLPYGSYYAAVVLLGF